jgi:hypothetical protein
MGRGGHCQVSFTPAATPNLTVESCKAADGSVKFHRAAWRDLPTMYHVVNALAGLPVLSARAGSIATTRGGKSYLDQRIPAGSLSGQQYDVLPTSLRRRLKKPPPVIIPTIMAVLLGGKADMTFCSANVHFWPKADIRSRNYFVGPHARKWLLICLHPLPVPREGTW